MSSRTESARTRAALAPILSYGSAALGLVIVAAFLYEAGLFAALVPKPPVPPPTVGRPEQITASHSTVNGLDRERQPYTINAETAIQDKDAPAKVHLEGVTGSFRRTSGEVLELAAKTALYDTDARLLDLAGDVTIVSKGRFSAAMSRARVVTEEKRLTTAVPVEVRFGSGTILSNGLEITDDGKRILFLNGVKARFSKSAKQGDGNP